MDDSFSQWRGDPGRPSNASTDRESIVISDTDEDVVDLSVENGNNHRNVISSDNEDGHAIGSRISRSSHGSRSESTHKGRCDDVVDDSDYIDSITEYDTPQKQEIRKKQTMIPDSDDSDDQNNSITISDRSYHQTNTSEHSTNHDNHHSDQSPERKGSSEDAFIESLVKKEIGVGNVDPFVAQRRAILVFNIQQLQKQLSKSKALLNSANIEMLPDKGEKLKHSIAEDEGKLAMLSAQINSLPTTGIPKRPPWETIPPGAQPKVLGKQALQTHEREQALTVERLQDLHGSLAACPTEDQRAEDPRGLKVTLMPHQQHALAWLLWRESQKPCGGILADDMGLGKTLTMISLVIASNAKADSGDDSSDDDDQWVGRKRPKRPKGGTLVVCPASLLSQWEGEVNKRCKRGVLSVELYHGNNRESVPRSLAKNDMVITTYNLLSRECKANSTLFKIEWNRVILDEAHVVRNHKSQVSEAACAILARKRWALTGTPIQNKELDLFALLKFIKCSPFDDIRVWKRWVDNKNAAGQERLATVMKTLMLRRTKQDLQAKGGLGCLPDKNLEEIYIELDPEEQLVYEKVLVYSRTLFAQFLSQRAEKDHMAELNAGKFDKPTFLQSKKDTQFTKAQNQLLAVHADVKAHQILVLLLRLRQICCHPALIHSMLDQQDFEGNEIVEEEGLGVDIISEVNNMKISGDEQDNKENEIGVDRRITTNLLTSKNPVFDPLRQSSKMKAVLALLKEILDKGDKAVVVSQWTSMLEVVREHLQYIKGASYDMLCGNVAVKNRRHIVESFNNSNTAPRILLLSLTAGGVGLNLVGGNHLLLLDIHWNPQLEAQAQDRIYRVGQTKSVHIYKFICKKTLEESIKGLQDHKLNLAQGVLTGAGTAGASKLSLDDLKSLFNVF